MLHLRVMLDLKVTREKTELDPRETREILVGINKVIKSEYQGSIVKPSCINPVAYISEMNCFTRVQGRYRFTR